MPVDYAAEIEQREARIKAAKAELSTLTSEIASLERGAKLMEARALLVAVIARIDEGMSAPPAYSFRDLDAARRAIGLSTGTGGY